MTIEEHVSCEIQYFDVDNTWKTYTNGYLSDADGTVISVTTKNQCCASNKFNIGGVYSGSMQLVCKIPDFEQTISKSYELKEARILVRSWYGSDPQNAKGRGVFYVTEFSHKKDIYTIRGMDAMSWTDTLSPEVNDSNIPYFTERITYDGTVGESLNTWFMNFFAPMNDIIRTRRGIETDPFDFLEFQIYEVDDNCGIWHGNFHVYPEQGVEDPQEIAYFGIDRADDGYKTEKPRDVLRWIAEAVGGFITVDGDGIFQLRQFCQPSLGIAEVYDAETEADSLEIEDYFLFPKNVYFKYKFTNLRGEIKEGSFQTTTIDNYTPFGGFQIRIELNAIMDGVYLMQNVGAFQSIVNGVLKAFSLYDTVDVVNGENVDVGSPVGKYKAYPVPFRCKVHKPAFFELGQTVIFPDHRNEFDNGCYGYAANVPYIRSVITEIEWTFRGGTKIACGAGEDENVMSLTTDSKSDAVRRELRNRTDKQEIWTGTSEEFAEIDHIPVRMYAVVDEVEPEQQQQQAPAYESSLYLGDIRIGEDLTELWRQVNLLNDNVTALQTQVNINIGESLTELWRQVNINTAALNGHSFWDGTQEEYDALGTYDSNTWYGVYNSGN